MSQDHNGSPEDESPHRGPEDQHSSHEEKAPSNDSVRPSTVLSRLGLAIVAPALGDGDFGAVLARGATWSVLVNFFGVGISFIVHILLARTLQAEQYGLYVYALAWMNVAMLVGLLEVNTAATRFVGEYFGRKKWSLLKGFLIWGHGLVVGASLTVAILAASLVWLFRDAIGASATSYLAACLLLPLTVLMLL